jgi:RimJ/RimL family protein N-acetyltransferase
LESELTRGPLRHMISLRQFTSDDFSRLIHWIDSPRLLVQWGAWRFHFPLDHAQLAEYLRDTVGPSPTRTIFTAIEAASHQAVGHIELDRISQKHRTASVCRVFVPTEKRGRGYGYAMVQEVVRLAFSEFGLRRLDLQVYRFNTSAIRVYEKVGFVQEGLLRQVVEVEGECWDLVWMGLLKSEWRDDQRPSAST